MCGAPHDYAQQIFSIQSESQKVRVFRNKTADQIESILVRLSEEIRKSVISKYYRNVPGKRIEDIVLSQSPNNNRQDADLYHICEGKHISIEVKFGEETSRNIGMGVFEKIFGTSVFSDATGLSVRNVGKENSFWRGELSGLSSGAFGILLTRR